MSIPDGWLFQLAGLNLEPTEEAVDLPDEVRDLLLRAAETFLRAGGHLCVEAALALSAPELSALIVVGDALRDEQAGITGLAAQSPEVGAALIPDGGEAITHLKLAECVAKASLEMEAAAARETST